MSDEGSEGMPESFDEAFPGGFDECVRTLGEEPSIDDPEKLCGWLQEHGFKSIADENPDSILAGLEVEFVSVVDQPAQDSEWLLAKSEAADPDEWTPGENRLREVELVVRKENGDEDDEDEDEDEGGDAPEKKVWAAVLKPGEADAHGDLVPEPEIETAAHEWLKSYRKMDSDHDLLDGEGEPVESYIVRDGPDEFETPTGKTREYPEGTWILGAELSDEAWSRVESGDLTGFSIYGGATKINPDALLTEEQAKALRGRLENRAKSGSGSGFTATPDADDPIGVSDLSRAELKRLSKAVEAELGRESMGQNVTKRVDPEDLLDAVAAFGEATGEAPEDTTLVEFVEWVQENPDYGETEDDEDGEGDTEGESEDEESGDDESEAEQASKQDDTGDMTDDDTHEILGEIRDTVKSTNEQVQKHDDRLDTLRDELDEVRKEVGLVEDAESDEEKESESAGDGDGAGSETPDGDAEETEKAIRELKDEISALRDELPGEEAGGQGQETTRKADKSPTGTAGGSSGEETVEKGADDDGEFNITFSGITQSEAGD